MANRGSLNKFIDYFSKPLNNEQLVSLNNINSIVPERVEFYGDFIVSLWYLIYDTYIGDDVMVTEEQYEIHYNWCWKKNIENFEKEHIFVGRDGDHQKFFFNYFYDAFYAAEDKSMEMFLKITTHWRNVFSIERNKTKSEYDIFLDIYKTMDKYFNKAT